MGKQLEREKKKKMASANADYPNEDRYVLEVHINENCMKFKGVFAVIKDLLFDCNVYFDETGMKICNLDNSKIALVHFRAPADNFHYYKCAKSQMLGVSITALHKYLGHISQNNKYTLKLMVDKDRTYELIVQIVSDDDTDTQTFYMKLLDLEMDEGGLDGEKFNCIISMPSDKFQRYCRSHALVGDVMDVITVGDQVELTTEDAEGGDRTKSVIRTTDEGGARDDDDDDGSEGNHEEEEEEERETNNAASNGRGGGRKPAAIKEKTSIMFVDKDDTIAGRFSLKFLGMFAKAQNLSPNVIIYFKKDYPLVLLYRIRGLGDLKFAIAPRVNATGA